MDVPANFALKPDAATPEEAVGLLRDRIALGEALMAEVFPPISSSAEEQAALNAFRRRVRRWQAENDTIIANLLEDLSPATSGGQPAAAVSESPREEFERLKDDVGRDVSQLSAVALDIQLKYKVPESGLGVSPPPSSVDPDSPIDPTPDGPGTAPSPDPDGKLTTAPTTAPQPTPTIVRGMPTGALGGYDADAVAHTDHVGIGRFVDAFSYLICARNVHPPLRSACSATGGPARPS